MLPARALAEPTLGEGPAFQQRTTTSWRSNRSQPAVSRRLFRCLGAHLPSSPLLVKSSFSPLGARKRSTHSIGGKPRLSCASIRLAAPDILKTSPGYRSQSFTFRCGSSHALFPRHQKQKPLLTRGKQGWSEI